MASYRADAHVKINLDGEMMTAMKATSVYGQPDVAVALKKAKKLTDAARAAKAERLEARARRQARRAHVCQGRNVP